MMTNLHIELYNDGVWQCPNTGMLIPLGSAPYTEEEIAEMERFNIDAHLDDAMDWDFQKCQTLQTGNITAKNKRKRKELVRVF